MAKITSAYNFVPLKGRTFTNWTVLDDSERRYGKRVYCLVRCVCGVERSVSAQSLRQGISRSCGCLERKTYEFHKHAARSEYTIWQAIRNRCNNPRASHFHRYGGRGIRICDRWNSSFEAFLEDMGPRPPQMTVERIDSDGHYEPSNCRWASRAEQALNRSSNRRITYQGETRTVIEWCRFLQLDEELVRSRLRLGWSFDDIVATPPGPSTGGPTDPTTGRFLPRRSAHS